MIEPLAVSAVPATPAFPDRPLVAPPAPSEVPLFQDAGLRVTTERVVARGRTLLLADVQRVETVRRTPRMVPVLATLGLCMSVGLPALSALSVSSSTAKGGYEAALIAVVMVIFGCIARLVLAEESYRLVLHTRAGSWRVRASKDPKSLMLLAGLIQDAVAARGRH
ncbi:MULTISPECIES: DUF6232 family protein [Myxococcus]|uniref:DUF6232 family protein n=1 Tax=Myxococcus TaxID=32 RepID=UPI00112E8BEC|nr:MULTISPECIES: DUF6232 family protein [Myxococcus]QDE98094.1 hypothetical protein BHS05_20880 [Myxococcus xanthus]WAM23267.1 DUF6232 family protein [Myxococcus sp. NMCA1]